jgi:hypothetical protein
MCAMPVVLCGSVGLILEISVSHLKAEIGSMKYEHSSNSDLAPHYPQTGRKGAIQTKPAFASYRTFDFP